jgi:hypothetical protein
MIACVPWNQRFAMAVELGLLERLYALGLFSSAVLG